MPPTDVLTADAKKILAEIATPAKRGATPVGQASPGKLGVGASLQDFKLLEKLGKGNCGTVHKARRLVDDELYVIKQIDIVALHPDELQQAVVEAQVLAALDNPYIIQYCDSFIDQNQLNIVMEYAAAGNLHEVVQRGQADGKSLSENAVWRYLMQLLLGLQHIHDKKIVHRDIKTLNIFLAADDFIKIGDLGVARFMSTNTKLAETVVGTPFYMSPELFEEKPYSTKTDVWALGCVLYEMCTYTRPFEASNQAALMLKILRGKYDESAIAARLYSPELQEIVSACLTMDPSFRPSIEDLLAREAVVAKAVELQIPIPSGVAKSLEHRIERLPAPSQFVKHFVGRSAQDRMAKPNASRLRQNRASMRASGNVPQASGEGAVVGAGASRRSEHFGRSRRIGGVTGPGATEDDSEQSDRAAGHFGRKHQASPEPRIMAPHGGGGSEQAFYSSYDSPPQKQTAAGIRERQALAAQAEIDTHMDREPQRHGQVQQQQHGQGHGQGQPEYSGRPGAAAEIDALDTFSTQQFQRTSDSTTVAGGGGGGGGGGRQSDLGPGYRSPSPPPPTADSRRSYSHNPTPSDGYLNRNHEQWASNNVGGSGSGGYATERSNYGQYYPHSGGAGAGSGVGPPHHQRGPQSQQGGYPAFPGQSSGGGGVHLMHQSSPVPGSKSLQHQRESYRDSGRETRATFLSTGSSAVIGAGAGGLHGGTTEKPPLFRELEIAPMHASTPPRQQGGGPHFAGGSMVPESPLGTFMQQQFGDDHRRGGVGGSNLLVGGGGRTGITGGRSTIDVPVGMMSPLSQLVNGGFTAQSDAAGETFWRELARSSAALDLQGFQHH